MRRPLLAGLVVTALTLLPLPAYADGTPQMWVTDTAGHPPGKLFTHTTLVPGRAVSETLIIHHTGAAGAAIELRMDPATTPSELEEDLQLRVGTTSTTATYPLYEVLRQDQAIPLGALPTGPTMDLELTVSLPASADNTTKEQLTVFTPVITAYDPLLGEPTTPSNPGTPGHAGEEPTNQEPTGRQDGRPGETTGSDSSDYGGGSQTDGSPGLGGYMGSLPHTGAGIAAMATAAAALVLLGATALWITRRRHAKQ